ncbi:hypothetical protein WJX73_006818 [Symbiochloris irregularis]|uniref:Uncharacterized protein n=1 Tax=Symbiochloris irregularis TaxID=706552 RepID=A0AAW1PIH0_9CHLO
MRPQPSSMVRIRGAAPRAVQSHFYGDDTLLPRPATQLLVFYMWLLAYNSQAWCNIAHDAQSQAGYASWGSKVELIHEVPQHLLLWLKARTLTPAGASESSLYLGGKGAAFQQ